MRVYTQVEAREPVVSRPADGPRPAARGKFLFLGEEKFLARGVTYGPFRPDGRGCTYHTPDAVRRDFEQMAAHGVNAVRTYTCPPTWLLDVAAETGLHVMAGVGLAGEQLTAFLESAETVRSIRRRCADDVRACAGHPALLAYVVGNEIPASMARWHGRRRVERFIRDLCDVARDQDPGGLVTYVNYPTTEYLQLPFLDFLSYNVYLETPERFADYLARLQSIADYKPLVMAEVGLDSLRNGVGVQAAAIGSQVRASFAGGCAGVFVFSWTDEWHTGGCDVENWRFGVTDSGRNPKPALAVMGDAFAEAPLPVTPAAAGDLPAISVVVCTHNGSRTIADCLEGCARLRYPSFEVIVVNDGSTDGTAEIAGRFDVRLINTPNHGLSHARNVGLKAATGEIVAYLDDDARPDEHWLRYLAHTFATSDHAGVGGPNIVPADDPPLAQCVANAPGGPTHVLLTDRIAEHIPGCNMAFRASRLREIGGFDTQFRIAGDDVDVCWRAQARGWTLGFNPAAVVWHRRRNTIRAYWAQQVNYGRAEAMLEVKWPEKYNSVGHVGWHGRLYGSGAGRRLGWWSSRVYHGVWACSPFQSLCARESVVAAFPLMPEWYLGVVGLLALGALGSFGAPLLLLCLPVAVLAMGATAVQAIHGVSGASFTTTAVRRRWKLRYVTAVLHLIQPAARLYGRLSHGLTPWRCRSPRALAIPWSRTFRIWSERWQSAEERLAAIVAILRAQGARVRCGGEYDEWDVEVRGGLLGSARFRTGIEEYPQGRQYLIFRAWPRLGRGVFLATIPGAFALGEAIAHSSAAAIALPGLIALFLVIRAVGDYGAALACLRTAFERYDGQIRGPSRDSASAADVPPDEREPAGSPEEPDLRTPGHDAAPATPLGGRAAHGRELHPALATGIGRAGRVDLAARRVRSEASGQADRPPGVDVLDAIQDMEGSATVGN